MLLAVAGVDTAGIEAMTRRLAAGEWQAFPPAQVAALSAAHRLSREPWTFSADDRARLAAACGEHRAVDWIWLIAWGNYMTSVADVLALPLEVDNVFAEQPSGNG